MFLSLLHTHTHSNHINKDNNNCTKLHAHQTDNETFYNQTKSHAEDTHLAPYLRTKGQRWIEANCQSHGILIPIIVGYIITGFYYNSSKLMTHKSLCELWLSNFQLWLYLNFRFKYLTDCFLGVFLISINLIISAQKTGIIIDPLFFIPIHWQDLPICLSVFLWIQPLLYILAQTFRISERTTEIESLFVWLGTSNPHCHQLSKMTRDCNSSFLKILRRVSNGEKSNLFSKSLWAIYLSCL